MQTQDGKWIEIPAELVDPIRAQGFEVRTISQAFFPNTARTMPTMSEVAPPKPAAGDRESLPPGRVRRSPLRERIMGFRQLRIAPEVTKRPGATKAPPKRSLIRQEHTFLKPIFDSVPGGVLTRDQVEELLLGQWQKGAFIRPGQRKPKSIDLKFVTSRTTQMIDSELLTAVPIGQEVHPQSPSTLPAASAVCFAT